MASSTSSSKLRQIVDFLKHLTVEPMIFLGFVAMTVAQVLQQVGTYQVMCRKIYAVSHPEIDCRHLANVTVGGAPAELAVQRAMASWGVAVGLSYVLPALVSDVFLGAYGDRYGRKVNMLLGMGGFMISTFSYVVLFTYPLVVPLYAPIIVNVVAGFTGYVSNCMIAAAAYLADTVLDPEALTIRMALMAVVMNLGTIVGPLLVGATSESLTQAQGLIVSQSILTAAFAACMILVRQVAPSEMRRRLIEKAEKCSAIDKSPSGVSSDKCLSSTGSTAVSTACPQPKNVNPPKESENESVLILTLNLLKETFRTYARPRPGNVRLYLFISAAVFFFYMITTGIRMSVLTLYLQKAPLSWTQNMIGYYTATQNAMIAAGTIGGVLVFKKLLRFTDIFIMIIACTSLLAEVLVLSMATRTWMVYVAGVCSSFSALVMPCTQSFLSQQVHHDETGRAFTAFGMSATVAVMISNAMYSPIYSATLTVFPGFVFLFAAFLLLIALAGVLWLHYDLYLRRRPASTHGCWKALIRSIFAHDDPPNPEDRSIAVVDAAMLDMAANSATI